GDRRPPRPAGPEGLASHEVVELVARLARLQPGPAQVLGRRGTVLLLRREVIRGQGNNSLRPLIRGQGNCYPDPELRGSHFFLKKSWNAVPLTRSTRPSLVRLTASPAKKVLSSTSTVWKPPTSMRMKRR